MAYKPQTCPRPTITEEPLVTIQLINEIRKVCEGCDTVTSCPVAKSAGALERCNAIRAKESALRAKAGC